MEKKIYETPQLELLGSVKELTAVNGLPTNGSVCEDFVTVVDNVCEITPP